MTGPSRRIHVAEPGDVWFFAYGSLMWDPGFTPVERRPAVLYGYHRSFCVASRLYRGTADDPGLVLGLDRGGSCRGYALRIAEGDRDRVFVELEAREMPEEIYICRRVRVVVDGARPDAYALVVDRDNPLYSGGMTADGIARRIVRCTGGRGANRDYLANTVYHLDELGIADGPMHRLLERVEAIAADEGTSRQDVVKGGRGR